MNIYNKIYHNPNGTLIGNWYEEQRLRDKTKEGRTIVAQHIPKKSFDLSKNIQFDPSKSNNTFDRVIGDKSYSEFTTTNKIYGAYFQPGNK